MDILWYSYDTKMVKSREQKFISRMFEHFAYKVIQQCHFKSSDRTSGKFWRFHVELSHFEQGWSYVEHVVHVPPFFHAALYLASWLRAPLVSLQAPLSVLFALSRLSFFPPRNTPFRTITEPITFEIRAVPKIWFSYLCWSTGRSYNFWVCFKNCSSFFCGMINIKDEWIS